MASMNAASRRDRTPGGKDTHREKKRKRAWEKNVRRKKKGVKKGKERRGNIDYPVEDQERIQGRKKRREEKKGVSDPRKRPPCQVRKALLPRRRNKKDPRPPRTVQRA